MPYIYVFLSSKKIFNPSAMVCFSLGISAKVAEGFDFSILQQDAAAGWLCGRMKMPGPQGSSAGTHAHPAPVVWAGSRWLALRASALNTGYARGII